MISVFSIEVLVCSISDVLRMEGIMEALVSEFVVYLFKYVVLLLVAVGGVILGIQIKKKKSSKAE